MADRTDWRTVLLSAAATVVISGVGWMVHEAVSNNSAQAVLQKTIDQHTDLPMHQGAETRLDRVESLVERNAVNQQRFHESLKELQKLHREDTSELRREIRRGGG